MAQPFKILAKRHSFSMFGSLLLYQKINKLATCQLICFGGVILAFARTFFDQE